MFASDITQSDTAPQDRGASREASAPGLRGDLAGAVAAALFSGILTPSERRSAVQVLELLARDVDRQVHQAVAAHLQNCGTLPSPLACELVDELDTVALPVIQYARLLCDPDLIEIIRQGNTAKQVAVAKRHSVSEPVSDELVDTRKADVVGALLANEGADISAPSLMKALASFDQNGEIHALMATRPALPMTVVHTLMSMTSEQLRNRLIERHRLPRDVAARLIFLGQERAIARTIATATDRTTLHHAVGRLKKLEALTPTLLLRLLFQGDLRFFEEAMVALTGASRRELRQMLDAADWKRFQELYREAGLPSSLFPAFRIAIDCDREAAGGSEAVSRSGFAPTVLDRLAGVYPDVCPADIEHVLTQLSRQPGAITLLQSSGLSGEADVLPGALG